MSKKIGLALSGGGARGLAHIGVLKVLQKEGICIDYLAGTSMGAVIAAAFSKGMSPDEIEQLVLKYSRRRELIKFIDLNPNRRGLLEGNRVRVFLKNIFGEDAKFEDLEKPLSIVSVDLTVGKEVVFNTGKLLPAIFSTSAIPGIFSPIEYESHFLVDGGVLNNLPVDQLRNMGADFTIAVDVHYDPRWDIGLNEKGKKIFPIPSYFLDLYRSVMIMMTAMTDQKLEETKPDIVIKPRIPKDITSLTGFTKAAELINIGEQSTIPTIERIKSFLG